jgi:hypothetical protein
LLAGVAVSLGLWLWGVTMLHRSQTTLGHPFLGPRAAGGPDLGALHSYLPLLWGVAAAQQALGYMIIISVLHLEACFTGAAAGWCDEP